MELISHPRMPNRGFQPFKCRHLLVLAKVPINGPSVSSDKPSPHFHLSPSIYFSTSSTSPTNSRQTALTAVAVPGKWAVMDRDTIREIDEEETNRESGAFPLQRQQIHPIRETVPEQPSLRNTIVRLSSALRPQANSDLMESQSAKQEIAKSYFPRLQVQTVGSGVLVCTCSSWLLPGKRLMDISAFLDDGIPQAGTPIENVLSNAGD